MTDDKGNSFPFSVPITQHVSKTQKVKFEIEPKIALKCKQVSDHVLAIIEKPEFFENRKEEISTRVFGTQSLKHPKI